MIIPGQYHIHLKECNYIKNATSRDWSMRESLILYYFAYSSVRAYVTKYV